MRTRDRIIENLKKRREIILSGGVNCIPNPFLRFRSSWPGIERGKYYCVTGSTKAGKTQVADYMFVYTALKYLLDNPGKIKLKVYYFTLEMSKDDKFQQFLSHILFINSKYNTRYSPMDLRSTDERRPLPEAVFDELNSKMNSKMQDLMEECVEFIEDKRTPSEITQFLEEVASTKGRNIMKTIDLVDEVTGEVKQIEVVDRYVCNDENEYTIVIMDHMSLVESDRGEKLRESMAVLSKNFNMIRNRYKFSIVAIHQQAADKEGLESFKLGKLKPSTDGLADNKALARDYVMMFGIFSPFKNDMKEYFGYDVGFFKDNIRFMEVIINREGSAGSSAPLLFDGAVNFFAELPRPDDIVKLSKSKDFVRKLRGETNSSFFAYGKKKKKGLIDWFKQIFKIK